MKNAQIFVDVDLTLIDSEGRLLPGAREGLERLKAAGCTLYLWSTNGADYARKVATRTRIADLFDAVTAKPDIIIDDMPGTVLSPFHFDVNEEESWPRMADRIVARHID